MAQQVDPITHGFRKHIVDDVDADVLVAEQRPGRAQKKNDREQDPLQLEPRIRAHIERFSNDGIAGGN
jgi:hypothetical protein